MASKLYDTIKGFISNDIFNLKCRTSTGAQFGSQITESASRFKTYAINSLAKVNSFLSIFSCSDWMINDATIGGIEESIDTAEMSEEIQAVAYATAESLRDFIMQYGVEQVIVHAKYYRIFMTTSDDEIICLTYRNPQTTQVPYTYGIYYTTYTVTGSDGQLTLPVNHPILRWNNENDVLCVTNVLQSIKGSYINLWDYVSGMVANQQLLQLSLKVSDFVLSNDGEVSYVAELAPLISEFLNSKYQEIREYANQLTEVFRNEGLYSAFLFLLNLVQFQSSAIYDDENVRFSFTDNSSLVPRAYSNGFLNVVTGVLSSAATIIAASGHWIIGAIAGITAVGMNLIGKLLDVDPSITRGSMVHYGKNLTDAFPVADGQKTLNTAETINYKANHDSNAHYCEKVAVPGGYLFFGQNQDGTIISEFHPDLHDRRMYLDNIATFVDDVDESYIEFDLNDYEAFMIGCSRYNDDNIYGTCNNDLINGHVSVAGDDELIKVCFYNTALFRLWTIMSMKLGYTGYSGDKLRIICDGHQNNYLFAETVYNTNQTTSRVRINDRSSGGYYTDSSSVFTALYTEAYKQGFVSLDPEYVSRNLIYTFSHDDHESWDKLTHFYDDFSTATLGHTQILGFDVLTAINSMYSFNALLNNYIFYDSFMAVSNYVTWGVKIPDVSASSFWSFINTAVLVSTIAVISTVIVAVGIKKILNNRRLKNNMNVERAYNTAVENPSAENIKAYNSARFKTNLFSNIFGGTTYSKTGYWVGSDDNESVVKKALSFISDRASSLSTESNSGDLASVIRLIRGA